MSLNSDNDEAFSAILGKTVFAVEHDDDSAIFEFDDGTRIALSVDRENGKPVLAACELEPEQMK